MAKKIEAAVIGLMGYAGEELLRLLSRHNGVEITYAADKFEPGSKERTIGDIYPETGKSLKSLPCRNFDPEELAKTSCSVVFLALPHCVSLNFVPGILKSGKKAIDLSADYRLNDAQIYKEWYGLEHTRPELLKLAVYGLPELYRKEIKNAKLIANPGCYPTSAILACAPLLKDGIIDPDSLVFDSKSGISGGGRKFAADYMEKDSPDTYAYKVAGTHRHIPEIEQELGKLSGRSVVIDFTPHIVPQERGMFTTLHAKFASKNSGRRDIRQLYLDFYGDEPFVKILPEGGVPHTESVVKTNFCEIGFGIDKRTDKLIVFSAIDNLVKGASGQAVQNMNIMFNFDEKEGLTP
jgi:N-acetyl-gamma-glutamyl-phosphate reductase